MRKLLPLVVAIVFSACQSKSNQKTTASSILAKANKVLFVVSNQQTYGNTNLSASNHFAEIVLAYDVLIKEGYEIDFVSPKGGAIPIGYFDESKAIEKKYLQDFNFMELLKGTNTPDQIKASNYMAVYYVGGGSAMFGVPEDKAIQKISMEIYEKHNGIISAVCHGSAGLVNLKTNDGKYLYANKQVNGYPDKFESVDDDYYKTFPFSIEGILKERGGYFTYSEVGWDNFSIADGRLITGQDPTAAASVAKKIIEIFKNQNK